MCRSGVEWIRGKLSISTLQKDTKTKQSEDTHSSILNDDQKVLHKEVDQKFCHVGSTSHEVVGTLCREGWKERYAIVPKPSQEIRR